MMNRNIMLGQPVKIIGYASMAFNTLNSHVHLVRYLIQH